MLEVKNIIDRYFTVSEESPELEREQEKSASSSRQAIQDKISLKLQEIEELKKQLRDINEDHLPGEEYEYDFEGDMAKTQLQKACNAIDTLKSILTDNQNLPEWVQSKITLATAYLDTAADYMKSTKDRKEDEGEKYHDEYKEKTPESKPMMRKITPFQVKPISASKQMMGFSMGGDSDYNDEM